eukprot:scaffold86374_cov19-Tisochrysis_lutea.AAC.4
MDALVNERQERLAVGTHLSEQLLGEHLKVGFKEWPTWTEFPRVAGATKQRGTAALCTVLTWKANEIIDKSSLETGACAHQAQNCPACSGQLLGKAIGCIIGGIPGMPLLQLVRSLRRPHDAIRAQRSHEAKYKNCVR